MRSQPDWTDKTITQWLDSKVAHPSSTFQRRSEAFLRGVRTGPVHSRFPKYFRWHWLTWITLPTAAVAILTFLLSDFSQPHPSTELPTEDLRLFEELVQMDETLADGSVMLNSSQLEVLQAFVSLPNTEPNLPRML